MNPGEGETSYARNSTFQSAEQMRMKPQIEEAIMELCGNSTPLPRSMVIADLGCSCGPNALTMVSAAVDAIHRQCLELQQPPPELSLLLNDLPSNDFNTTIKHLVEFQERKNIDKGQHGFSPFVMTSIVPGSFYGRLFTTGSVHLVLSSNSLHWLSKVPEDLLKNGIPMYHSDEQLRRKTWPVVLDAYAQQFRKDLLWFLECRAQEMVPGGRLIVSLTGTQSPATASNGSAQQMLEFIARILDDMASRGVLDKQKLKAFYIPLYSPSEKEVKEIIEEQGSFSINKLQVHDPIAGVNKAMISPKIKAYALRAAIEPIILDHFGSSEDLMDEFTNTAEKFNSQALLQNELTKNPMVFLALSLERQS
ncbi:jasmonate O-methyltransferase [Sorghum bicolor]|nr:jasmonate O-methyltransferase [Sorghum bicolor]|eukprot:XP_002450044.2 jasmonate O-methyltransferase [Sorghum bicolor]